MYSAALEVFLLEDVRRDALHTVLFDNRHQTHFNVVHGWVGPKGARHGGERRDLKWCDS